MIKLFERQAVCNVEYHFFLYLIKFFGSGHRSLQGLARSFALTRFDFKTSLSSQLKKEQFVLIAINKQLIQLIYLVVFWTNFIKWLFWDCWHAKSPIKNHLNFVDKIVFCNYHSKVAYFISLPRYWWGIQCTFKVVPMPKLACGKARFTILDQTSWNID